MMYDGGWGEGWGWGGSVVMCVLLVLFWVAVITAVVLAVRYLAGGGGPTHSGSPRPEDVLAGRFARGEIGEDEYRRGTTMLREHRRT